MICEIIYPVGNGRLCSIRRERMVEVCPCNTYICIVCTINNHQMDNLERTSKKIITLAEHTDHFVATSTDDQVDLPLPKSMCLLIVRGSVVRGYPNHLHDVSLCAPSVEIFRTGVRTKTSPPSRSIPANPKRSDSSISDVNGGECLLFRQFVSKSR